MMPIYQPRTSPRAKASICSGVHKRMCCATSATAAAATCPCAIVGKLAVSRRRGDVSIVKVGISDEDDGAYPVAG